MRSRGFGFAIALAIFVADQLTKAIVAGPLQLQVVRQINVMPIFDLTWTENYGISLGLLNASSETGRWLLVALTSAIAIGVAYWIGREKARGDKAALGMILGGALGNILDRTRHGYVVDFADLHIGDFRPFMIFNVADACITLGVLLLVARALLLGEKAGNADAKPSAE